MRPPKFWQSDNGIARLLEPFGQIVGAITARKLARATPERVNAPVICVGNLTVGGTGKTPVAHDIATRLRARELRPAILLRGYGGSAKGSLEVDIDQHTVDDVGDEALLHARDFMVWAGANRLAAARAAIDHGASVLVMDDGHQHATLAKNLSLIVIDGPNGFGNNRIIPAGPLRENVASGIARAHAAIIMGADHHDLARRLSPHIPVLRARLKPSVEATMLRGQRVVAFAGIGNPRKFFTTLEELGAQVVAKHPFDDHYAFEATDIQPILDEAYALNALPVTTAKDAVRLSPDQRQQVNVLSVTVEWEKPEALQDLIDMAVARKH